MTREFKLPGSGFEVITKILHAYAVAGQNASLQDVAKKSGLDPTMVSRNNSFLLSIKAIEGGRQKSLTSTGKQLALAIGNSQENEAKLHWATLFRECEETKSAIEMIKIQRGIPKDQFAGRLASTFGVVADGSNKTGLNSIADILVHAHLIREEDGKYVVNDVFLPPAVDVTMSNGQESNGGNGQTSATAPEKAAKLNNGAFPDVHVNIQVHISPESTPEQIEKIFESMAKYLRPNT